MKKGERSFVVALFVGAILAVILAAIEVNTR